MCTIKRNANVSTARQMAMYIIREITGMSMEAIGSEFQRDHSTVVYSINTMEKNILKIGDAFLNEKAGSMIAHIYGVASTYSLDKVKKYIEGNPALVEVLNGYALAQQDN